ncbi:MAG: DUF1127 domain-containing protein [Pseudomonadota bacterium]
MTAAFAHPVLAARFAPDLPPGPAALSDVVRVLAIWRLRARTRADLGALDPLLYRDLGLTTAEVLREVAKPFWRA